MQISTHMTPKPVTVASADTLDKAKALMDKGGFRRLPVIDNGKLVGIVTERDLRKHEGYLNSTRVDAAMASEVVTVPVGATVEEAARLMIVNKIGGVPVVDNGKLVGIVTATDVLKAFLHVVHATQQIVSKE
jgi:acetoin utilization protein AcuB